MDAPGLIRFFRPVLEGRLKYPVFCLESFGELSNVRAFSENSIWSVAQALNRREKGGHRNKLNIKSGIFRL